VCTLTSGLTSDVLLRMFLTQDQLISVTVQVGTLLLFDANLIQDYKPSKLLATYIDNG